jgi:hypothetical protein
MRAERRAEIIRAHEDDAERAVRTGLDIIRAVGQLKTSDFGSSLRIFPLSSPGNRRDLRRAHSIDAYGIRH